AGEPAAGAAGLAAEMRALVADPEGALSIEPLQGDEHVAQGLLDRGRARQGAQRLVETTGPALADDRRARLRQLEVDAPAVPRVGLPGDEAPSLQDGEALRDRASGDSEIFGDRDRQVAVLVGQAEILEDLHVDRQQAVPRGGVAHRLVEQRAEALEQEGAGRHVLGLYRVDAS